MANEIQYPYVDENNILWLNRNLPINQFVDVKWNSSNKKHFETLGYTYTKMKDSFRVDVRDLPNGSHTKIIVYCPIDMQPREIVWSNLLRRNHGICKFHTRFIDLTNKKFGSLTVLGINKKRKSQYYWECQCDCGNITIVRGSHLRDGEISSCGKGICNNNASDLAGERFGDLLVIKFYGTTSYNSLLWKCLCVCGNIVIAQTNNLRSGHTTSCNKGKCNHNYNPNLTEEHRSKRRLFKKEIKEVRNKVYKRDNHTCQCCGERGGRLQMHHLYDWSTYPDFRFEVNNCITVCKDCHKAFHDWMGGYIVSCTKEDWNSWIISLDKQDCYI